MAIPDTAERRLHSLRQRLAVERELAELIKAVASDTTSTIYSRTHGAIESHAMTSHTLGEAKGVESFIKSITANPTGAKNPR